MPFNVIKLIWSKLQFDPIGKVISQTFHFFARDIGNFIPTNHLLFLLLSYSNACHIIEF